MKNFKLILGLIIISFALTLLSQENNLKGELIRIGDLFWDIKLDKSREIVWEEAVKYCAQRGMRLPSKEELISCQDELSKLEDDKDIYLKDKIGQAYRIHRKYWSSTEYEKDSSQAWSVSIRPAPQFQSSSLQVRKSYKYLNVRCVKDADKH